MVDVIGEVGLGLDVPTNQNIYVVFLDGEVDELKVWIDGFKLV